MVFWSVISCSVWILAGGILKWLDKSKSLVPRQPHVCFWCLIATSLSTVDLVRMKFQDNKYPTLTTSPHPVGMSTNSVNSSTGQKRGTVLYHEV